MHKKVSNNFPMKSHITVSQLRNFIFGVEDSLVSTVGLISGVAIAGLTRAEIFTTGIILIFVEAFSMGVGSYLSEFSSESFKVKKEIKWTIPLVNSLIMFSSYLLAGFIPLSPYIIFGTQAFWWSIVFTLITLFILGSIAAKITEVNLIKGGLRMLVIGGIAVLLGVTVGQLLNQN